MSLIHEMRAGKLEVQVYDNREDMGAEAAKQAGRIIRDVLSRKPECNIVFAAAPSQNEFLKALLEDKSIDLGRVNAFHMDEYIGLAQDAPQGFGNFLRERLFGKAAFQSVHYLDGNAADAERECERYAALLKQHPTDMVCMGIGENGHLAFNDPHVARFDDERLVKVVDLDERCRVQQVNDGCFADISQVPTHALTLTIPALMAAEQVVCIVPAKTKADAVYATLYGEISEICPASILRTHDKAKLYLDRDSGSKVL